MPCYENAAARNTQKAFNMKTSRFLFVHGWGFDQNFWELTRKSMGAHEGDSLDFGYFGKEELDYDWSRPFIAVGHSLGFLWLLRQPLDACIRLISINGFSRFFADPDWSLGVPQRVTKRMRLALRIDPEKTLHQFYDRLKISDFSQKQYNISALDRGLEWLMTQDNRDVVKKHAEKIAVLAGNSDPIVSTSLTESCFSAFTSIHWKEKGQHLLPITEPDACAHFIRDMADCIK